MRRSSTPGVGHLRTASPQAVEVWVLWADGTFPDGLRLIHVMLPVYAMVLLPSMHYRDDIAARALADSRPLLTIGETEYVDLHFRLAHLPRGRRSSPA